MPRAVYSAAVTSVTEMADDPGASGRLLFVLALFTGLLLRLVQLGSPDLFGPDEGAWAVGARNIVEGGLGQLLALSTTPLGEASGTPDVAEPGDILPADGVSDGEPRTIIKASSPHCWRYGPCGKRDSGPSATPALCLCQTRKRDPGSVSATCCPFIRTCSALPTSSSSRMPATRTGR